MRQLQKIAFLGPHKGYDEDGKPLHIHQLDNDAALLTLPKKSNQNQVLELLMRHSGMLNTKVKVQGTLDNNVHQSGYRLAKTSGAN